MAGPSRGPFRDESIERLSSPERLDQLLVAVDRRSWLPLATFAAIVAGLLGWSVLARVPIHVEGRGILARPRGIVDLQAPGAGYLTRLSVRAGQDVRRGELLAEIDRPDLDQQISLAEDKLAELTALKRTAEILRSGGDSRSRTAGETGDHLEHVRALAERIRSEERAAFVDERARLSVQLEAARELAGSLAQRLDRQRGLFAQGLISELEVVADEGAWLDATERVTGLETSLAGITSRELEVEDRYFDRLRRIADFGLELQDYGQQIAETRRELARLAQRRKQEGAIVAEYDGRILELNVATGQFLQPGERLGTLEVQHAAGSLQGLSYFSVRDGKRIDPRSLPAIRVTPDTVERERYGGIEGEIESVSAFPVSLEYVERAIGNREVARGLIEAGYRIEVVSNLRTADTASGFAWSSSRGPEMEISPGTTTTARVSVEQRRPITFVLPYLRTLFGID